jgi:hypothetical protein
MLEAKTGKTCIDARLFIALFFSVGAVPWRGVAGRERNEKRKWQPNDEDRVIVL